MIDSPRQQKQTYYRIGKKLDADGNINDCRHYAAI
jgi:hypothetical protein